MLLEALTLNVDAPLAEIRFGRAIDAAALNELERCLVRIQQDDAILCTLLSSDDGSLVPDDHAIPGAFRSIEALPQPVIAVIDGACVGTGLELALACDLRIASTISTFVMPQVGSGEMPVHGGTQRLPRLIGRTRALQMILLGETIDAPTALAWGLVNDVTEAGAARARAFAIAASICARGPLALRFAKEAMLRGIEMPLEQALRYETDLTVLLQTTADRAEGVRAFLEKRQPRFEGK